MIELAIISAVAVGVLLFPKTASAHCDTPDGPVIIDGKKSLESGDIDLSLKWITAEYEAELKHAFDLCRDVRGLSDNARKVADHHFLETLVRLHRAGEGAPYTGIKPAGSEMSPVIAAADESMETRSIEKLLPLITEIGTISINPCSTISLALSSPTKSITGPIWINSLSIISPGNVPSSLLS